MSNPRRLPFLLLATGALLLASACDTSEDPDGRYSTLLRLVPDQASFRDGVTIVDYEAIRTLPGYEQPTPGADDAEAIANELRSLNDALQAHDIAIPFREVFGTPWDSLPPNVVNWQQGFGFGLADVDLAMTAGTMPPRYLHAIGGEFDPAAIEAQLDACAACIEGEQRNHRGQRYFTWGGNQVLRERLSPPAFDDLGRGGYFVFDSDYVLRSNFVDDFEASIDASQGRSSLLGDENFALLADELDSRDLIALFVSSRTPGPDYAAQLIEDFAQNAALGEQIAAAWDIPAEQKLAPYQALAVAVGLSEGEPFTAILLAHDSAEAAAANVERLNNRIETGVTVRDGQLWLDSIDSADITTEGRLLIATLRGSSHYSGFVNSPGFGAIGIEALLAHE